MTYIEVAQMQRAIHLAADPQKLAREISAQQFRPEEKAPNGIEQRKPEPNE